ncbi:MAG: hypothetical protein HKN47_00485 [Pirellulaceae bacterium]|nr:hypothetical protein [Pirellulaceae bacterium]
MPASHRFVLVFHFPRESPLRSADIEDDLAAALGNELDDPNADHVVDGNDVGVSINIFVLTRDPIAAFTLCKPLLSKMNLLDTTVVAYREQAADELLVLHPVNYKGALTL